MTRISILRAICRKWGTIRQSLRRWKLQYPLYMLFVCMFVAAVPLAWLSTIRQQCERERRLAREYDLEILQTAYCGPGFLSSTVGRSKAFHSVIGIETCRSGSTPLVERIQVLNGFDHLRAVCIHTYDVMLVGATDPKLAVVDPEQCARALGYPSGKITSDFFVHLAGCTSLSDLEVEGIVIDDETLKVLARLPNLKELCFEECDLTNANVEYLLASETLEWLDVRWSNLSEETVRWLRKEHHDININY